MPRRTLLRFQEAAQRSASAMVGDTTLQVRMANVARSATSSNVSSTLRLQLPPPRNHALQGCNRLCRKNGAHASQNKPPASKPPTAPHKRADSSSVPMQRRGRLARMSNSAQGAASDRSQGTHAAHRSQAALTSTEIFGGLLLGNL